MGGLFVHCLRATRLVLILVLSATTPVAGQTSSDDVLRVETAMVVLPVRVIDKQGRVLRGLEQNQFHVYENGVMQDIAHFEAPGDLDASSNTTSLTIALMLDISDSTEFKLGQIQDAAIGFVDLLRPGDRVIVVAFDKTIQFVSPATTNRDDLRSAIRRLRSGGGTGLYAAVEAVINQQLNVLPGRKAIVLLSDGVDTASRAATAESSVRAAEQSYVAIYPIQYQTYGDFADSSRETYAAGEFGKIGHMTKNGEPATEAYRRATLYLRLLADKSGGQFQFSGGRQALIRGFSRIADELRNQYTIGYYPKNRSVAESSRRIKVLVDQPAAKVETRKSYIYKPTVNR
jgi:VWFA-related protein